MYSTLMSLFSQPTRVGARTAYYRARDHKGFAETKRRGGPQIPGGAADIKGCFMGGGEENGVPGGGAPVGSKVSE